MSVFAYGGRLYEVNESSPVDEDGYHYECWDITANSGGELGRIVAPEPNADDGEIQVGLTRP
jgi:hypothetical protein